MKIQLVLVFINNEILYFDLCYLINNLNTSISTTINSLISPNLNEDFLVCNILLRILVLNLIFFNADSLHIFLKIISYSSHNSTMRYLK